MEQEKLNIFSNIITDLVEKYKDNGYMLQRIDAHIQNLPNMLEQENKKYDERISRINELTLEQDNFHKVFLSKHQYFYMPHNNLYYEYDGKTYKVIKDDDIHHHLLSTITDEGKLIQWKHKTKQNIIKKIKERSLIKSTPETFTIQNVLGFLLTIFPTKTEAKYFLTIIGDCILKKNVENLFYFVSSSLKKIITFIDSIGYITTGNSILNHFITKYHDSHKLNLYRLIKTNEYTNQISNEIVKEALNNIGLDLLCVATHYSERYTNADNYLNMKNEENIKKYVFYFVENNVEKVIDEFILSCIQNVSTDSGISWKNMHYIWKLYLSNLNIPNMIYLQQLQTILTNKLKNKIEDENIIFTNITSKYLPNVSSFLSFWDKHITIINDSYDDEYEIDELMTLYKLSDKKISPLTDSSMIQMIGHYFSPQVEVIDNKYITNIKCNLWLKQEDINEFLQYYRNNVVNGINNVNMPKSEIISFDELYQNYKSYFKAKGILEQKTYPIVSKQFFEKNLTNQLSKFIKFDKFVSFEWFQN